MLYAYDLYNDLHLFICKNIDIYDAYIHVQVCMYIFAKIIKNTYKSDNNYNNNNNKTVPHKK